MTKPIIEINNLSKSYRLGTIGATRLVDDVERVWHQVFGREPRPQKGIFHALQDVSFHVEPGEVVGIIGRNGAGKSTLLKVLSRITEPTRGEVILRGRVASLLEVGTGFVADLTGRENVFLNGAILGMTRAEVRTKFDEIVAFAEVDQFIDTPVKRYSSGMYVRLAFAVAAHLEPEILIVDEVLAVGDAEFQKKCLGKMGDVSSQGRTILFVSHNMTAVQTLCHHGVMLAGGRVVADGPVDDVLDQYRQVLRTAASEVDWVDATLAPQDDTIRIDRIAVVDADDNTKKTLTMQTNLAIETDFTVLRGERVAHITYHLLNDSGVVVLTTGSAPGARAVGRQRATFFVPGGLLNSGVYTLKLFIVRNENKVSVQHEEVVSFSVADATARDYASMSREPGVIQLKLNWTESVLHDTAL